MKENTSPQNTNNHFVQAVKKVAGNGTLAVEFFDTGDAAFVNVYVTYENGEVQDLACVQVNEKNASVFTWEDSDSEEYTFCKSVQIKERRDEDE